MGNKNPFALSKDVWKIDDINFRARYWIGIQTTSPSFNGVFNIGTDTARADCSKATCNKCGKELIEKACFTSKYMACPDELLHEKQASVHTEVITERKNTDPDLDWRNLVVNRRLFLYKI